MNLTEIRKTMSTRDHVQHAINRCEFPTTLYLKDPYQKLAACVILQALIDACEYMDFTPMHPGVYRFYSDMINLNASFETLRDEMLVRIYVFGENVNKGIIGWTDRTETKNTDPDMENNSNRRDSDDGVYPGIRIDLGDDFGLYDLYGGTCN